MKCTIHYVLHSLKLSIIRPTVERGRDIICTLPMRSHEWTRMPAQRKSVKDKCVAGRGSGWRHNECVQRIERVFSHAHQILFDAYRWLPLRGRIIPEHRVGWVHSAIGTVVAWGSQVRKVRRKKRRKKRKEFWKTRKGKKK